jgi:hypothetical protein
MVDRSRQTDYKATYALQGNGHKSILFYGPPTNPYGGWNYSDAGFIKAEQFTSSVATSWPQSRALLRSLSEFGDRLQYNIDSIKALDIGSDFYTHRQTYSQHQTMYPYKDTANGYDTHPIGGSGWYFGGNFFPVTNAVGPSSSIWPKVSSTELNNLWGIGSTAIARCNPTNPVANVLGMLGELKRDGLPSIKSDLLTKDRFEFFKSLGSDYLNVEFGWKPFVSDLRKIAYAVSHSKEIMAQYERDSGKPVRRRYRFPTIRERVETDLGTKVAIPAIPSYLYESPGGPTTLTQTIEKEFWFSGQFTYYLEAGDSVRDKMVRLAQEADKLLGVQLTPDVLWNLAPWSWLSDWFVNFGDLLANFTSFGSDGLVMHHGYVMGRWTLVDRYSMNGFRLVDGRNHGELFQQFKTVVKARRKASPYGFGISPESFTTRQWAILAALGMTQAPGVLKSM